MRSVEARMARYLRGEAPLCPTCGRKALPAQSDIRRANWYCDNLACDVELMYINDVGDVVPRSIQLLRR